MESFPVGTVSRLAAGLCEIDAKPSGDEDKTCPLALQNRFGIRSDYYIHNTSIRGVLGCVNTLYTGVNQILKISGQRVTLITLIRVRRKGAPQPTRVTLDKLTN